LAGSFVIRRARQSDAAALCDFAARLFRATYASETAASDLDSYIDQNFSTERQAAEIADPSAAVLLATADDIVIGYADVIVDPADAPAAFLNRIYIDADWRGRGLANHLLDAILDEAARRGATRLTLTVFERNSRAIAFYKKVGFTPAGTTTFTVGDDVQTDIVMEMDLAARSLGRQ
jgi:ribosomal protein S18 acetylase RimI-like enzyme